MNDEENRPLLSGTVVLDVDGDSLLGVLVDEHVRGVSPDGREIYMESRRVVSSGSHRVIRNLPFSLDIFPNGFVVDPTAERLYSRDQIVDVRATRFCPMAYPDRSKHPNPGQALPFPVIQPSLSDGRYIVATSDVVKIDTKTLQIVDTRGSKDGFETDLLLSPAEDRVLLVNYSHSLGRLEAYDMKDLSIHLASAMSLSDFAGEAAVSASGAYAVVGAAGNPSLLHPQGRLSVVDLETFEIVSWIDLPLADNVAGAGGSNEFFAASGEGSTGRLGITALVLGADGTLTPIKTWVLGVNRHHLFERNTTP